MPLMDPTKPAAPAARRKTLLGMLLVERGLLTAEQLALMLDLQAKTGEYLGTILIQQGLISEPHLMEVLAEQVGLPYVKLADTRLQPEALAKVPPKFASQYRLVPLRFSNGTLEVAIADPFDVRTLDELKLLLHCNVKPVLAGPHDIQDAIQRHYGVGAVAVERLLDDGQRAETAPTTVEDLTALADTTSIVSFVNQLIQQAVRDRATDIHIEPYETYMRIRERVDGILYEMSIPPDLVKLHQAVVSRIKVMANLDIAERRLPQDGRMKVRLEGADLDLRVSVLPTSYGEGVDIRILASKMLFSLEQLGLAGDQLQILSGLLARPHGIIFVTGPTGSGKTTTLYACLSQLNVPGSKIITIEDPVEYQLPGISQIQVHPKIGLSFAQGLRSMLRHDPDIMMVGEVRDPETAEITIRSALTGHLVFSTLHTNDAAGGVTRLLDMGIEPYLVASSVLCFIAQRLVRVICESCKEPVVPEPSLRQQFGVTELPPKIWKGRGCPACKGAGYKGRTAIYEFLVMNEAVHQLILAHASSHDIARAAQQAPSAGQAGMRTLRQDGWTRILQGHTTPQEVLRVS
jgi:type II secretion system protein E